MAMGSVRWARWGNLAGPQFARADDLLVCRDAVSEWLLCGEQIGMHGSRMLPICAISSVKKFIVVTLV